MLRWWIRRRLDAEEKKLGASVDDLRHLVDQSLGAIAVGRPPTRTGCRGTGLQR